MRTFDSICLTILCDTSKIVIDAILHINTLFYLYGIFSASSSKTSRSSITLTSISQMLSLCILFISLGCNFKFVQLLLLTKIKQILSIFSKNFSATRICIVDCPKHFNSFLLQISQKSLIIYWQIHDHSILRLQEMAPPGL